MKNIYSKKLSETLQKSIADSKVVESECLPQKKTFFVRPSEDSVSNLKILLMWSGAQSTFPDTQIILEEHEEK